MRPTAAAAMIGFFSGWNPAVLQQTDYALGALDPLFGHALTLHQTGRLTEAHQLYLQLLERYPGDAEIMHLMGVLAGQNGRHDDAARLIRAALARTPGVALFYRNLASSLESAGHAAEAAEAWNDCGNLLQQAEQFGEALGFYDKALALVPGHFGALSNRGAALSKAGKHDEAIAVLRALTEAAPQNPEGFNNLGNALLAQDKIEDAVAQYHQALSINADYPEALSNLGPVLQRLDDPELAAKLTAKAVELNPAMADALINQGNALAALDDHDGAVACYRKAVALRPDAGIAHWNLALGLLAIGKLAEGFAEYKWRWRWADFSEKPRPFAVPMWKGEKPQDLKAPLFVHCEQGLGDTIQFCRYVRLLAEQGHRVIFEVQRPLYALIWQSFGDLPVRVVSRTDSPLVIDGDPVVGAHIPLLSLPALFGTDLESVPETTPYLQADSARVARWAKRLPAGPCVGVCWTTQRNVSRNRVVPLDAFLPLLDVRGVTFISLQKGAEEALPPHVLDFSADFIDFGETAAVIANLDLVITIDTSVAHLAGAMGRPCWVLLPKPAEWRWLRDRADSPWYARTRLYRQQTRGDWAPVIARARKDLESFIG
jgi:tetratricopeptide (TPR) repeat protein